MKNLQIIEIKGQRVLTTRQIAEAYETTKDKIIYNFNYNKNRYILGKHYIEVSGDELRRLKTTCENQISLKYAKSLYLWTEKGALLHAKSLNTNKAWEVYDYLVDFYFRAKDEPVKDEIVPVKVKTSPLPVNIPAKDEPTKAEQDAVNTFRALLQIAEKKGLKIYTNANISSRSVLVDKKIAVRSGLTLEEVNYELAFEIFHLAVNYDKGDLIHSPLSKFYFAQAERAADFIVNLLNVRAAQM